MARNGIPLAFIYTSSVDAVSTLTRQILYNVQNIHTMYCTHTKTHRHGESPLDAVLCVRNRLIFDVKTNVFTSQLNRADTRNGR